MLYAVIIDGNANEKCLVMKEQMASAMRKMS